MSSSLLDQSPLGERYQLLSVIGSGASAEVYHATDLRLDRGVAVKQLRADLSGDPRFKKLFRTEAHLAAQLSHPNILTIFDWNEDSEGRDGGAYIVTELLGGGTLRDVLHNGGTLSESQATLIGIQTAQGLAFAHEQGLVHRDIKPANLLFGLDERVRIADFGIARAVAQAAWTEPEGVLIGTARYAAPEQAVEGGVHGAADVYSLALCLAETLTGEVPLVRENAVGTMVTRQMEDVAADSRFGALNESIVAAGYADPSKRISAAQFLGRLVGIAQSLPRPEPLALIDLTALEKHSSNVRYSTKGALVITTKDQSDLELPADPVATAVDDGAGVDRPFDYDEETNDQPDSNDHDKKYDTEVERASVLAPVRGSSGNDPTQPGRRRSGKKRRLLVALMGVAIAAGAVGGGWFYGQSRLSTEVVELGLPSFPAEDFSTEEVRVVEEKSEAVGISTRIVEEHQDGTEVGDIIRQVPPPGETLSPGDEVIVYVSLGPFFRAVPELVGASRDDASSRIAEAKLAVGDVVEQFDESVGAGVVMSATVGEDPAEAGAEYRTDTSIDLVVSAGPRPREVPGLAGKTVAEAESALEGLGLNLVVLQDYSTEVANGNIISVSPESGSKVQRGSDVTVIESLGLPFVTIPNVEGMAAAAAADQLEADGFVVIDTVGAPNGEVLATDPPAGESHRLRTEVVIFTRR